jgi:hypothetical protein
MQLSNEDNLRLNVLLAQPLHAIRISEGTMTVYALTEKGEAKVQLNPTTRDEQYLRWVRELLSMKITGSPSGYPLFIKRWTRMGQTNNTLEHMLLLGEPEAIVAMVHSPTINHEMACRAWWAHPTTEVARRLLHYPDVIAGKLGKELIDYLLEFLPFEEQQLNVVDTVRLSLQGNLIAEKQRDALWERAKRKNPYYVGFLHGYTNIPLHKPEHPSFASLQKQLSTALATNNIYAQTLCKLLSPTGQNWLETLKNALYKPVDQEVVISLFQAVDNYFTLPFPEYRGTREITDAEQKASRFCTVSHRETCPQEVQDIIPLLKKEQLRLFYALLVLAQLGEDTLIPIFTGNDSVGTVMRRRLKPVTTPILENIDILML